ncbi:GSCOCT00014046001.2-RA-CDS [Cotesia congregata]|uniref:Cc_odve66_10 n=1 Tax=Cotesia congregata TaxID=51543 RepID=A0A8J2HMH2_COTCN|nr:GSCOCT00014046001.2-RA-CDS [Cotesia congregata]CAG5101866.1 Cc_odve66_10 [Cotesia congregata]
MKSTQIAIIVVAAVLSILYMVGVIALGLHLMHKSMEKKLIAKISYVKNKLGYLAVTNISKTDEDKFNSFQADFSTSTDWHDNPSELINLCNFATLLIKYYNLKPDDKTSKEYLKLANDILKKLNERIFKPKDYSTLVKSNSCELLSTLLILLNTFDYLADETYQSTKTICHKQILEMVPEFNKIRLGGVPESNLNRFYKDYNVIYTITARLLTNIKHNRSVYQYDVEQKEVIQILKTQFDYLSKTPEEKNKFHLYEVYYSVYQILSNDAFTSYEKLAI